jgi:hypothetical protein
VIADELPKISYQTLADVFITTCFAFLVVVTIINAIVGCVARDHFKGQCI